MWICGEIQDKMIPLNHVWKMMWDVEHLNSHRSCFKACVGEISGENLSELLKPINKIGSVPQ